MEVFIIRIKEEHSDVAKRKAVALSLCEALKVLDKMSGVKREDGNYLHIQELLEQGKAIEFKSLSTDFYIHKQTDGTTKLLFRMQNIAITSPDKTTQHKTAKELEKMREDFSKSDLLLEKWKENMKPKPTSMLLAASSFRNGKKRDREENMSIPCTELTISQSN